MLCYYKTFGYNFGNIQSLWFNSAERGVKWLTTYPKSSLVTGSEFVPQVRLPSAVYKLGRSAPFWDVCLSFRSEWSSYCRTSRWRVSGRCASWSGLWDCMTSWTRSRSQGTCTWRTASVSESWGSWSWSSHASQMECPRSALSYLLPTHKATDLGPHDAVLPEEAVAALAPISIS